MSHFRNTIVLAQLCIVCGESEKLSNIVFEKKICPEEAVSLTLEIYKVTFCCCWVVCLSSSYLT